MDIFIKGLIFINIVPTFEENEIFILGVVFCQFSAIGKQKFLTTKIIHYWRYRLPKSESKKYIFYLQLFFAKFWDFENSQLGHIQDYFMSAL